MRVLVIYTTSHGTSEKVANQIIDAIYAEHKQVCNLKKNKVPNLKEFDTIIIGSSIHAGTIPKKMKKFCERNREELLKKRLGLYLCHMYEDEAASDQFKNAFPESLRDHAFASGLFGGEFLFEKMNFFEKLIVKRVVGVTETTSKLNTKAIVDFVAQLQEL
jgi:menaquinone-dependent protoporphyrinogen oxidase